MSAPKDIRALHRGLQVLELLNMRNGAGVTELTKSSGLPKSSVYRILENLSRAGYVAKRDGGDGYWLTARVRRLSFGLEDDEWIRDGVRPLLVQLTQEIAYPVAFSSIFGTSMIIRANTDDVSDLVLDRYPPGTPIPLFESSSGWIYLAYCDAATRDTLLDICRRSDDKALRVAQNKKMIRQRIGDVRRNGYALQRRQKTQERGKASTLAVPVLSSRALIGALVLRYIDSALTPDEAVDAYLSVLKRYARRIGQTMKATG